MHRRVCAVAIAALSVLPALSGGAQDILVYLNPAVEQLTGTLPGRPVLSFGTFTYADKKVGSGFSRLLEEALSSALQKQGRCEVFARDKLDEILAAQELSLSDLVDEKTAVSIGKMKGIQALLSGTFFTDGTDVKVYLELVSVESATVSSRAEARIPRTAIPTSVSMLPDNYNDALYVLDQLAVVQSSGAGAFEVRAWSVRGDGGTYRGGEKLVVSFYASRDCFIKVYHVDVAGKVQLIFPNPYYKSNSVRAGQIYRIPDESYPFTFDLGAPYGTEFIKVVASTTQFTDIEKAFEDMGKISRGAVSRGLSVTAKETQVAEATFSYTILK